MDSNQVRCDRGRHINVSVSDDVYYAIKLARNTRAGKRSAKPQTCEIVDEALRQYLGEEISLLNRERGE